MKQRGYPRNIGKLMPKVNEQAVNLYMFIVRFFAAHGYMPSVREMYVHMGGRSTSVVAYHISVLVGWQWIVRSRNVGRGMRLTRPTERGLKPAELRTLLGVELVALDPPAFDEAARQRRYRARIDTKALIRQRVKPFGG